MHRVLAAVAIVLFGAPVGAETMTCALGASCGVGQPYEYMTSIEVGNDEGTEVWIGYWDDYPGRLLRYDPVNCTVLGWIALPGGAGVSGMARDGNMLWLVRGGDEAMIYKYDTTTWTPVVSFPAPSHSEEWPNPRGLAWDGQYLWHVDWNQHLIYKLNPESGAVLDAMPAPGELPWGLEYQDGRLYCVDQLAGTIYAIDPATGALLGECTPWGDAFSLHSQGLVARPDGSFWLLARSEFQVLSLEIDWAVQAQSASWSAIKSRY